MSHRRGRALLPSTAPTAARRAPWRSFQQTETVFPDVIVALQECGAIPDPALLQSSGTKWLFFNVWASPYCTPQFDATAHLQEIYSSDYVIGRDELRIC